MSAKEKLWRLVVPLLVGIGIYLLPHPETITDQSWRLAAIFVATIVGIVLQPLPMGAVAIMGLTASTLTHTLPIGKALNGWGQPVVWLVVLVFFISRGFIKTNLGSRIAYLFIRALGKRTLGLGYGLAMTDLVIAPVMPSNTARCGGIVMPILQSINHALGSFGHNNTRRHVGSYLTQVTFQTNLITSAMFLTAMVGNPMAQAIAAKMGVEITWMSWFMAAIVPGIASLILIPLVLYWIYPPDLKVVPAARQIAEKALSDLGPMSRHEWMMVGVFILMLGAWIIGPNYGIDNTSAALLTLCVLLLSGILTWSDILAEREAWQTLIWLGILVGMAKCLDESGVITTFSSWMRAVVVDWSWLKAFVVLALVYFYAHYLFASNAAHVSAMYAAFLATAIAVGTPPLLAALVLGFFSSLFSSMTHYGTAPGAILFATGYVPIQHWWGLGLVTSVVNIAIWLGLGSIWWRFIGIW